MISQATRAAVSSARFLPPEDVGVPEPGPGELTASDLPVASISRVPESHPGEAGSRPGEAGSRRYAVDARDGSQFDVVVFDRQGVLIGRAGP